MAKGTRDVSVDTGAYRVDSSFGHHRAGYDGGGRFCHTCDRICGQTDLRDLLMEEISGNIETVHNSFTHCYRTRL